MIVDEKRAFGWRLLDGLAFSNVLPAAIAAALTLVALRALDPSVHSTAYSAAYPVAGHSPLRVTAIAASGAFVIYGIDRIRKTRGDPEG